MAEKQQFLPLGAAFSHARASGKDQSQSAQRRRANDFLRREGHGTMSRKVAKGILDRWRAMTTDERADEFNLRASGVPPEVARALAMTGNGKAPKRKPKFGGLISKMGPTLAELDAPGHTSGLTGSSALRGATWRRRRRQQKRVNKGGPGSGPHPGGGVNAHLSAAQSHLAAAKVARGKGDHESADGHQQKARERIRAALTAQAGVSKTAVAKRHMVSQIASTYIQAAYEPPRLPAGEPQYTDPPEFARYLDAQRLVAGMDREMQSGAETAAVARTRASRALATSMGHYDRAIAGSDRALSHVGGLNLDLGSGQSREFGFLGVNLYPADYGTVVADLGMGIPFPDGSARAVRCWNALGEFEDYRDDATQLMREVQRVLTIGGRFYYQGPPLQDLVDWSKLPGLGVVSHQFGDGGKVLTLTLQRQAARLPVVYGADVQQLGRSEASPADMAESLAEYGDLPAADVAMANLVAKTHVDVRASIVKKRDYDRVCLGVVLVPSVPDSQNDVMTAEDIEKTAHNFLADARLVGKEHSDAWEGAQVVESYIAPVDMEFADPMYGPQTVPKGSWVLGVRLPEESFGQVLSGDVTGFSVGGWGEREDVA